MGERLSVRVCGMCLCMCAPTRLPVRLPGKKDPKSRNGSKQVSTYSSTSKHNQSIYYPPTLGIMHHRVSVTDRQAAST